MRNDTEILTIKDRLRKAEASVEYCISMTLPFAHHLVVIRYLRKTLRNMGMTE